MKLGAREHTEDLELPDTLAEDSWWETMELIRDKLLEAKI